MLVLLQCRKSWQLTQVNTFSILQVRSEIKSFSSEEEVKFLTRIQLGYVLCKIFRMTNIEKFEKTSIGYLLRGACLVTNV